jgi:hypothetical protein
VNEKVRSLSNNKLDDHFELIREVKIAMPTVNQSHTPLCCQKMNILVLMLRCWKQREIAKKNEI